MREFLKIDMADEEQLVVSYFTAETIEQALEQVRQGLANDDRLSPCYGHTREECLTQDENSVQWSPGDGGQYTIAIVLPNNEEGRELASEYVQDWL